MMKNILGHAVYQLAVIFALVFAGESRVGMGVGGCWGARWRWGLRMAQEKKVAWEQAERKPGSNSSFAD